MVRLQGQRPVRALVLGVVLFLFLGGGTGFASAAADEGEPPAMAFPRPGSSATYAIEEFHVGEREVDSYLSGRVLTLTWMPEAWVVDRDYNLRLVHPLSSEYLYPRVDGTMGVQQRDAYYDAATGEAVVTSGGGPFYSALNGVDCGGDDECRFRYDTYGGRGGACAMRNALQQGQGLGKPLRVTGYCDYIDGQEELTYRYVKRTQVGATDAYLFQDPGQPRFKAWFSPEHAFPVRFTSTLSDEVDATWLGHERMYDLRLQSETAGAGEYTRPAESVVVKGPGAPALRPAGQGGDLFDFDGFPKALSFPEAYRLAAADATEAGLAGFLSQHPGAYVAESYAQQFKDDNGAIHDGWYFVVSDGVAWKSVAVQRGPPGVQMLGLAYWAPPVAGEGSYMTDVFAWDLGEEQAAQRDAGRFYPAPEVVPTTLPRPADLLERYQFIEDRDIPDASYFGWSFKCENPACLSAKTWIGAGYQLQARTSGSLPLDDGGYGNDLAILTAKPDGTPVLRYAFSYDRPGYAGLLGDGKDQSSPDYRLAPQSIRRDVAGAWQVPAPAAVAGLSFLALVASALYWSWPALKGAAVGLFSRTRDDKLLEHPRRAQLAQLVEAEPGIHFQDIARRLGMGRGTLDHHLRKLLAANLLTKVQHGGYACYFPKGAVDRRVMAAAPLLRSGGGRAVFEAVRDRPGRSGREIATALGLAQSTVSYHLRRLQEAGLVFGDGAGVRLSPLGEQAAA